VQEPRAKSFEDLRLTCTHETDFYFTLLAEHSVLSVLFVGASACQV